MKSYRSDKDGQSGTWAVNQESANTLPHFKIVSYSGFHNSPTDAFQGVRVVDSGYASPLTDSAMNGPYGTYYGTNNMTYPASSGTYPGARSTITVTKIPDNQAFYRSQEYEDSVSAGHPGETYPTGNSYSSQTLPVNRSPSSYRSVVMTQVVSGGGQDQRSPQVMDAGYRPLRSEGGRPVARRIDIQVQQPRDPPLPQGASSRLVYSAQPPALGIVRSKPFSPALQASPDESAGTYSPTRQVPVQTVRDGLRDPRPYQLKPTMDPVSTSPGFPRPLRSSNFEAARDSGKEAEVDALTDLLMQNMQVAGDPDFFGMCARCGRSIMGDNSGCSALDQLFHIDCFRCISCHVGLRGHPFYAMEGKPYCEQCFMSTLERCSTCSKPITDRMLRATGKPYHPNCFNCVVCRKNLDGVAFTIDATSQIHCIEDFHRKFAPRCCVCNQPIMPRPGKEETIRIVALDRSFHIECYRCEDCGMLLSSESEGRGCYPLDDHILCKGCNAKHIQALTTKMTTEL